MEWTFAQWQCTHVLRGPAAIWPSFFVCGTFVTDRHLYNPSICGAAVTEQEPSEQPGGGGPRKSENVFIIVTVALLAIWAYANIFSNGFRGFHRDPKKMEIAQEKAKHIFGELLADERFKSKIHEPVILGFTDTLEHGQTAASRRDERNVLRVSFYNDFLYDLSDQAILGIEVHELCHIISGHIDFTSRSDSPLLTFAFEVEADMKSLQLYGRKAMEPSFTAVHFQPAQTDAYFRELAQICRCSFPD